MMAEAQRRVRVHNITRGTTVAADVRVARSMRDRMVGLLQTSRADLGDGLLIEKSPSIHMFFMKYPIDAVFLDAAGRVTKIARALQPWRLVWWAPGARDCLELPVGRVTETGTQVGDTVEIRQLRP